MEVSSEKSKVMKNSSNTTPVQVFMNGQELEEVSALQYLGATLTKDSRSTVEIKSRIAIATSTMAKLDKIWKNKGIRFPSKMKLYRALVLSTLLYGCESWTMSAETTKKVQTFETKCFRRMLGITWQEKKTNDYVRSQVTSLDGPQEPLLAVIKRRKMQWFSHVTRHDTLPKTILQGTLEGGNKRGRQQKAWFDNIKEWTRMDSPILLKTAENRVRWRQLARTSSLSSPLRPQWSGD